MDFVYYYKTSDGARHEATMSAPSREFVFEDLRKRGIKAIKVVSKSDPDGVKAVKRKWHKIALTVSALTGVCVGASFWTLGRWSASFESYLRKDGSEGRGKKLHRAEPMSRRQIMGNQELVATALTNEVKYLFANNAEIYLAAYAQPGKAVSPLIVSVTANEFEEALRSPIFTFPDESTECVELKRIVAGMKEELKMFLASGGTIPDYINRLNQRQEMEIDYREKAEDDLYNAIKEMNTEKAYEAWEQKNAWLTTMGIERLPLPAVLTNFHPEY